MVPDCEGLGKISQHFIKVWPCCQDPLLGPPMNCGRVEGKRTVSISLLRVLSQRCGQERFPREGSMIENGTVLGWQGMKDGVCVCVCVYVLGRGGGEKAGACRISMQIYPLV